MNQGEKATRFAELHVKGIATSSWSVAAAQGYQDGEDIPLVQTR